MLKTDRLFSDHMVLQRGKEIKIWGICTGEKSENPIKVSLSGKTVEAHRDESGKWTAVFPPLEADRRLTLTVENGTDRIEIKDVNIGEVWVAAGQSNMEFYMRYDADCITEKDQCENQDIRFFDVPEVCYPGQEDEYDYSRMGFWRRCTPEDLEYFSAAAYYFAKKNQPGTGCAGGDHRMQQGRLHCRCMDEQERAESTWTGMAGRLC